MNVTDSGGATSETTVDVQRKTIESVVKLSGKVDSHVQFRLVSPVAGKVLAKKPQDTVAAVEDAAGQVHTLALPESTKFSSQLASPGDTVSVGTPLVEAEFPGLAISATVPTTELYRLYNGVKSIQVQVKNGPGPFDCTILGSPTPPVNRKSNGPGERSSTMPPFPGGGFPPGAGGAVPYPYPPAQIPAPGRVPAPPAPPVPPAPPAPAPAPPTPTRTPTPSPSKVTPTDDPDDEGFRVQQVSMTVEDFPMGKRDGGSGDRGTPAAVACVPPADTRLFFGAPASLKVTTGRVESVLSLPVEAVAGRDQKGRVRLTDGQERDVELGLTDGQMIEIKSGLAMGDKVTVPAPSLGPVDRD